MFSSISTMLRKLKNIENLLFKHYPKILLNFFRYRFIQKDFLAELQLCSPGGAGRNRVLSKKDFLEISILKPSVQEQTKIAEFLTAIDKRIDHTTAQLTHTKQWKKGLLQQMFV